MNGVWIRVLDLEKFEKTKWTEDRKAKNDLVKQDSLLRTWQHSLDTADSKVGFDPTDWYFKPSFGPSSHNQKVLTYFSAETVPISDTRILLIFSIGLVLVLGSKFGRKFFKGKKRKSTKL